MGLCAEGPDSDQKDLNPGFGGSDWASREGQDFIPNSKAECIDYVGIHVWPDNWNFMGTEFQKKFIQSHIDDVKRDIPGKPFVLEEFGKIVDKDDPEENKLNAEGGRVATIRNAYFQAAFEVAEVGGGGLGLEGGLVASPRALA